MTTVVFDFDRTLTQDDTTYAFFAHAARSNHARALLDQARLKRRLRLLSRAEFKAVAAAATLAGLSEAELAEAARQWAAKVRLRSNVVTRLRAYLDHGQDVYVASASFEVAVSAVLACLLLGAPVHVVGSTLAARDGRITGVDVMCEGRAKLDELRRRHGVTPDVVFTDGRGDLPLMRAAREVHLVVAGRIVRVR